MVAWDGWIDVTSRKTRLTFYRCLSGTVCFRRVFRRDDNGEANKSSCILIVTFLLKLRSQWLNYALGCVFIDVPIGEMKKKKIAKMSEFIHNLARGRVATACFLLPSVVRRGRGKIAEKKGKAQFNVDLFRFRT